VTPDNPETTLDTDAVDTPASFATSTILTIDTPIAHVNDFRYFASSLQDIQDFIQALSLSANFSHHFGQVSSRTLGQQAVFMDEKQNIQKIH